MLWQIRRGLIPQTAALSGGGGGGGGTGTWNPSDKDSGITLSGGNLTATGATSAGDQFVRATTSHSSGSGKYYFEITAGSPFSGVDTGIGICTSAAIGHDMGLNGTQTYMAFASSGHIYYNNGYVGYGLGSLTSAGTVICFAIDMTNKLGWMRVGSGFWVGSSTVNHGDPAAGTFGLDISALFTSNAAYPVFVGQGSASDVATANFGATAFAQSVPSGFSAWG